MGGTIQHACPVLEEDDDENENDYIKDGFVVDEDEVEFKKKKKRTGDLEDSDDDDELYKPAVSDLNDNDEELYDKEPLTMT